MMYIVEDDTKEEANSNVRASSSSRLSNVHDIVLLVFLRDTSCRLYNRYPGHNSHLLLHYKKTTRKYELLCEDLFYECYHIVEYKKKIVRCTYL